MKLVSTFALAALIVVAPSCDGKAGDMVTEVQASAEKGLGDLKNLDVSALSADAMKGKVTELTGTITEKLGSIKDLASAKAVKDQLQPALDALGKLKDGLGGKLPDMSSVTEIVNSLKEKFAGKTDILDTLKPMFEKLMNLVK